jgi:DNA-binding transcriptional LysR family regulator
MSLPRRKPEPSVLLVAGNVTDAKVAGPRPSPGRRNQSSNALPYTTHSMDYLTQLPVLLALEEKGSVSQAANALGLSQPAVSAALAKLRLAFDDPLFVRNARGMSPTPRALALVAAARPALAALEGQRNAGQFEPARTMQPWRIALSDAGELVFLPRLMQRLRACAPGAAVHSVSLPMPQIIPALEAGEIDIALGYFPELKSKATVHQRLFTHTYACLLRADHPCAGDTLTLAQFAALEHAAVRVESRSQEVVDAYLARKKITRHIALTSPHFMSVAPIVATTNLVVTVPHALADYCARIDARLKVMSLAIGLPKIDLLAHWHRRFHHDARNLWLRQQVRELFNDQTNEWKLTK